MCWQVMKTCTFYIIFITVLINGGTSASMLQRLRLRAEDTPALLLNCKGEAGVQSWGWGWLDVQGLLGMQASL